MLHAKNKQTTKHVNNSNALRVTWYVLFIISILSGLNDSSSKQELQRHKKFLFLGCFFFKVRLQSNIHPVYNKQADADVFIPEYSWKPKPKIHC